MKETAAKCIPNGFSLFYTTSDQQLNTISETIKNASEDNKYLTEAIIGRYSKVAELSSLLKECSEESVEIFKGALIPLVQQTLVEDNKDKSSFVWTGRPMHFVAFPRQFRQVL